jgi:hypothetical protein
MLGNKWAGDGCIGNQMQAQPWFGNFGMLDLSVRKTFLLATRLWLNWPLWGGVLAMMLLAQHTWVLFAPAEPALPGNTTAPLSSRTGLLFGNAASTGMPTSSLDGLRPIGIFAHGTQGFAVMQTPTGQRGVGLGSEVSPGIRLIETHADHVVLEHNGIRQRVDLSVTAPASLREDAQTANTVPLPDQLPPGQQTRPENNQRGLP